MTDTVKIGIDRYMDMYETMRQGQDYMQRALDGKDAAILRAILGEDTKTTFCGKPIVLRVEWPEGKPWPDDRLQAFARDMLDGLNRRHGWEVS